MESFWRVSGQSDGFACTRIVNFGDLWRSNLNFEVNVVHLNIDQEVILNILTPRPGRSYGITCAMLIVIYSSSGFLAATYCNEEKNAMLIAIGTILPCFLLSGAIFPSEALPLSLQYIGYLLPGTLPGDSLRAILLKGWGMGHYVVWIGFVSAVAWIIIYWTLTAIYHFIWD